MIRRPHPQLLAWVALAAAPALAADQSRPLGAQATVSFFVEAEDDAAYTPDQLAARARLLGDDDPEAVAADATLNQWKGCVQDALARWAPLAQGPGALIDGAYGRCADLKRSYRDHLVHMQPGGRSVIDVNLSRNMARTLEDGWRPRLTAIVLDQQLAR